MGGSKWVIVKAAEKGFPSMHSIADGRRWLNLILVWRGERDRERCDAFIFFSPRPISLPSFLGILQKHQAQFQSVIHGLLADDETSILSSFALKKKKTKHLASRAPDLVTDNFPSPREQGQNAIIYNERKRPGGGAGNDLVRCSAPG